MDVRKTPLQRAFELARSGKCASVHEIIARLKAEKYEVSQIEGPALKKQLLQLIENSKQVAE